MPGDEIVRYWKDPETRAALPDVTAHPSGSIEVWGGAFTDPVALRTEYVLTIGCCPSLPCISTPPENCGLTVGGCV
ncbi:hypothetical protein Pth03_37780 [Planotetraspora thailandica]|uniref:Mersacidin/lichenicidin family type 2 lantibiotic n=1 Tax=Planotetraspora thailandica TaxID=487172 RepID=A0A8J3V0E1_9ACTN|nr:mersacidin/lichenicidin family type 2 lantibiotic [Planotetraspora thailandica]GII55389.1 hypothetical protein Pth03_37780 [Planotetraspora thailandica]